MSVVPSPPAPRSHRAVGSWRLHTTLTGALGASRAPSYVTLRKFRHFEWCPCKQVPAPLCDEYVCGVCKMCVPDYGEASTTSDQRAIVDSVPGAV